MAEEQGREAILQTTLRETIFYIFFLGIVVTGKSNSFPRFLFFATYWLQ